MKLHVEKARPSIRRTLTRDTTYL